MSKETPHPGSDEAIKLGCICPVLDNRDAAPYRKYLREDCPVHSIEAEGLRKAFESANTSALSAQRWKPPTEPRKDSSRDVRFVGAQYLARIDVAEESLAALHFADAENEGLLSRIRSDLKALALCVLSKMEGGQ